MTAEMDVNGDVSEVREKCALDMSTYEDLPKRCNVAPPGDVTAISKDDADGSYVFVSSTDANSDDHLQSDLNGGGHCVQNVDLETKLSVQNGSLDTDTTNHYEDVGSSQKIENQTAPIINSDTGANGQVVEIVAETSQKADENEREVNQFSDIESNSGVEIGAVLSQKVDGIQIIEENGMVAITESSGTEANRREEVEVVYPHQVEDMENEGENGVLATTESSATLAKCEEETNSKSSQRVENAQIAEDNAIVPTGECRSSLQKCGEETEVGSLKRVEGIQESQYANLEAAHCDCVNGKENIDKIENQSLVSDPVEEIGEYQITSFAKPDQSDISIEENDIKGDCTSGLALTVENSEETQIIVCKDDCVVGVDQKGSNDECSLLEPSEDNTQDMEHNLAADPSPKLNLVVETDIQNGSISKNNTDGVPTGVDLDGPLDIIDYKNTEANFHDNTIPLHLPVNCEIATLETHNIPPTEVVSDPDIELSKITMDGQETNGVLELEQSTETGSHSLVDDCTKVEVLKGTISENGDDMPSAEGDNDDSVAAIQSMGEENESLESIETIVSAAVMGNAPDESFSTLDLNGLKSDHGVDDNEKFANAASAIDDVQPDEEVGRNQAVFLAANTRLETKSENGHSEEDSLSMSPSDDVTSESVPCLSIGHEEKDSIVYEVPKGVSESSGCQPDSILVTGSELHDDKCNSVLCTAAKERSGDDNELTSSMDSRNITGDVSIMSESEVAKVSLVNDEGGLNTLSDVVPETDCKPTEGETEAIIESRQDEPSSIPPECSTTDASEGNKAGAEVEISPFYYLIRVPRYDDENIKEQIKHAQSEVDSKTQDRDAIRVQIQTIRASRKALSDDLAAAVAEERASRDLLKSKRQEMDSVQSLMTKVKNAMSVEDIDGRIRIIEHTIVHETLSLKEEKQSIREIKQLKQLREQLSLTTGKQDELQQALNQKDQIEERLKLLRKEADSLRDDVLKAESITKAAKMKYNEENVKVDALQSQFNAADKIRQEAYANLQSFRKQSYEKSKYFWKYRDDVKAANDLASKRDREGLKLLCVNQVETMMNLWNTNDEFRKDYVRCNTRSTLRRLKTLDGRSLGPNEEPPVLENIVKERSVRDKDKSVSMVSTQDQEKPVPRPTEIVKDTNNKPEIKNKVVETKNKMLKSKTPVVSDYTEVSGEHEAEEIKRTKEEEELAAKAEQLRKEKEEAMSKERRKLEEKIKAKEALERKKRNAERAEARAEIKARKEAEERQKQREKRAKKKERKIATAVVENGEGVRERDSLEIPETPSENPKESENTGDLATAATTTTKRSRKPSPQYVKQNKAKSIPPPLRNRGRRRMQPWLWWALMIVVIVLIVFFIGQQWLLN